MAATTNWMKPDIAATKPEVAKTKLLRGESPLRDFGIRLALIPTFGIVIPNLTGLFGPIRPGTALYWAGYLWFIGLAFLLWHGNRYFLLLQRRRLDWFQHRWRKVILLLAANVLYTTPVTIAMLLAWYGAAGFGPEWPVIHTVTLMNVICVIFITHTYETVYLIQQRESDLVAFEKLERARTQAELTALKSQVDPHFLFNALNTLSSLIPRDPSAALRFNENLADVYRYILLSRDRELVLLEEEMDFLLRYFHLLEIRFGSAIVLELPEEGFAGQEWLLPPISLQVLVENAAKHNEFSAEHPLRIRLRTTGACIEVANTRRIRSTPRPGEGMGLRNLAERCRAAVGADLAIDATEEHFRVTLPMRGLAGGV